MARGSKLSQAAQQRRKNINNAKLRFRRQAERYRTEAKNLGGRDAEILMQAADKLEQNAQELNGINVRKPSTITDAQKALIKESKDYLVSNNRTEWQRGETLGKLRLSGTAEGHRFYALTESLWSGEVYEKRLDAIRDALSRNPDIVAKYGANPNANQMIEIVESITNISLTDDGITDSKDLVMMRGVKNIITAYG